MVAPRTTIWNLEPHTRAKHEILKIYLQAWVPILNLAGFKQILYIDGFAGPGRYSNGEQGSPVIAIQAALDQQIAINCILLYLFIEYETPRAEALKEIISDMDLPANFHIKVANGTFESAYSELMEFYRSPARRIPPTFAFIDPFGWTGVPFYIVREILSKPSSEVLITFMYEEINRFIGHPDQDKNFDLFFGTASWRDGIDIRDPGHRNRFLHDLYLSQLSIDARAKYVRSFQMRNDRDKTDYYLFYATNSIRGLGKMKDAMWKVDESGEFTFSDATNPNQLILFEKLPDFAFLQRQVREFFKGSVVTVGEVERFVVANTAFCSTHYKQQVLSPFELANPPVIEVVEAPAGRPKGTFADPKLRIRFI